MNVAVVKGRLTRPAEERRLRSGTRLVTLEVSVSRPGQRMDLVPVGWLDAPPAIALLEAGEEVLVIGRVRRRFFRSANGTASRTEVAAEQVVPTRHRMRSAHVLAAVAAEIEVGAEIGDD